MSRGKYGLLGAFGHQASPTLIGDYHLSLPSGLVLVLNNCCYVSSLTKNIISVDALFKQGYNVIIDNGSCSILFNKIFYCSGRILNGIYILDLENEVYHVNTKRLKSESLNFSYLWHCCLGHVSDKHVSKLHKQGDLGSFDYESYDTCESCLKGKMSKSPFNKNGERAKETLELIHSDVCGPMSTHARGGYLYFVTFIDDYSRVGYVYLM